MGLVSFCKEFFKKKIYVLGDSHVTLFTGEDKIVESGWIKSKIEHKKIVFYTNKLGAVLAFNVKHKPHFWAALNQIKSKSTLILVFGEIDCRVHLIKNNNIEVCIDRYFDVIKEISEKYHLIVFCPIASTNGMHENGGEYAAVGTCLERNNTTIKFNMLLKQKCEKIKVSTIDIFPDLITKEGVTNMDYYFDEIHLAQKSLHLVFKQMNL